MVRPVNSWKKSFITSLLFFKASLTAQIVEDIEIRGLSRFSESTVLVNSAVAVGDDITEFDIKAIINNLFLTDFFDDIAVVISDQGLLTISVIEKPVISNYEVKGNSHIKRDEIDDILIENNIAKGRTYSKRKLENVRRALLSKYAIDGFYTASVNLSTSNNQQGRIELKIEIDEGEVARIAKIVFHGNNNLSDYNLRRQMNADVTNPISIMMRTNTYSQFLIEQDIHQIEQYYANKGYPGTRVISHKASLNEAKSGIIVDIFIQEAPLKKIVGFQVEGLDNFDVESFLESPTPFVYSQSTVHDLEKCIKRELHNQGYFLQKIETQLQEQSKKHEVVVLFKVIKGQPIYLKNINISGNDKTRETVVRNHITLPEGSLFSATKLEDIEEDLHKTGFFDSVNLTAIPLDKESVDLNVILSDASSKKLSAGIRISNITNGAEFSIEDNNFFGTGKNIKLDFNVDKYEKDYTFSYFDPYALNNTLGIGYSLDYKKFDYESEKLYNSTNYDRFSMNVITQFKLRSHTTYQTSARYSREWLPKNSTELLKKISLSGNLEAKNVDSIGLTNTLITDTYNFYRFPTKGYKTRLSLYLNTPLSDFTFFDLSASAAKIWPMKYGFLFYSSLSSRYVGPYGSSSKAFIPSSHYVHFEGADDIRGFHHNTLGPRTAANKVAEGNFKVMSRSEVVIPNNLLRYETDNMRLSVFFDAGQVYRTFRKSEIKQNQGINCSTGI